VLRLSDFSTLPANFDWTVSVAEAAKEVRRLLEITMNNRIAAKKISCRVSRNRDFKKTEKRTWLKFTTGIREEYEVPSLGDQLDITKMRLIEEDAYEASKLTKGAQAALLEALETPAGEPKDKSPYILEPEKYIGLSSKSDIIREALRQGVSEQREDSQFKLMVKALIGWLHELSFAAEHIERKEIEEIEKAHCELVAKLRARQAGLQLTDEATRRNITVEATPTNTAENNSTSRATAPNAAAQEALSVNPTAAGMVASQLPALCDATRIGLIRLQLLVQAEFELGDTTLIELFEDRAALVHNGSTAFEAMEKEMYEKVKDNQNGRAKLAAIKRYIIENDIEENTALLTDLIDGVRRFNNGTLELKYLGNIYDKTVTKMKEAASERTQNTGTGTTTDPDTMSNSSETRKREAANAKTAKKKMEEALGVRAPGR
jgi:hypothetical protein